MTRWKASAIHLALSVLVLATIAAVLVWRWYPPGLFGMANADKLLLIIAGVDIVIGPLLTLVVYKPGKKTLKFDLTVIALLQMAAMGYGLNTVWQSRPVYMVAVVDRFQLVFANELDPRDLADAPVPYRKLPWLSVDTIAALLPADHSERQDLLFLTLDTGKDLHLLPRYYAPYPEATGELLAHAMPATDLAAQLPSNDSGVLTHAIGATRIPPEWLVAVPIASGRGDATMLLDARDGVIVGPVAVDPWSVFSAWAGRKKAGTQKSAPAAPSPRRRSLQPKLPLGVTSQRSDVPRQVGMLGPGEGS